jgi:hypothetical protein
VGNNSKEPMCLQGYARVSHFSAAQYWKETDISSESRLDVAWWAIKSFGTAMEPKSESSALFIRKEEYGRPDTIITKRVWPLCQVQPLNYKLSILDNSIMKMEFSQWNIFTRFLIRFIVN